MFTEPVLVLAYNKPELLRFSLSKLRKIHCGKVYIHLDGPKSSELSQELFQRCKDVLEEFESENSDTELRIQTVNLGGQLGVLEGINWFFEHEDFGIILEEDIDYSEGIFQFVDKYKNMVVTQDVFSICFFNPGVSKDKDLILSHWLPWGWATSAKNWRSMSTEVRSPTLRVKVKLGSTPSSRVAVRFFLNRVLSKVSKGRVDTWDAQVHAIHLNRGLKSVFPTKSYSKHLGFVPEATHADQVDWWSHISISEFQDVKLEQLRDSNNKEFEFLWRMTRRAHTSDYIHKVRILALKSWGVRKLKWL